MLILSIETSCDETAVAVTRDGREILADSIFSQVDLHAVYGGVVPELASRAHVEVISKLADDALNRAEVTKADIEAVAVTNTPGLIGALLVGVNFAKGVAMALDLPLVPVHHIRGHIAANYLAYPELEPPFTCLVVSGGHSLIIDVRGYTDMSIIGSTRDDAAGECFDKIARVLGLGYPGGAKIDKLSQGGDDTAYKFPRSVIADSPYDMSFSGLKTAVLNTVNNARQSGTPIDEQGLAASFCAAVSDTLVGRTIDAAVKSGYGKLVVAGGVAANSRIRRDFEAQTAAHGLKLYVPPLKLCGDNAAMIGSQGYYEFLAGTRADLSLNAFPTSSV